MIADRLRELQARCTASRIYVGPQFWSLQKLLSTPIVQNRSFLTILGPSVEEYLGQFPYQQLNDYVQAEIHKYLANPYQEEDEEEQLTEKQQKMFDSHIPIIDVETGVKFLWSREKREVSKWNYATITNIFFSKMHIIQKALVLGKVTYDPLRGGLNHWVVQEEGHDVTICNQYRPPIWNTYELHSEHLVNHQETYPPAFVYYLQQLVPNAYECGIVLDWLALAVCDRPESMLVLRGIRGNGKSIIKGLFAHLIGDYLEARDKVNYDFNVEMKNKRLIVMDDNDFIGTRKGHVLRKRLTNPTATFQEKHVQVKKTDKQFASFMICANESEEFYLEWDERKVVMPTLSNIKMEFWQGINQEIFDWFKGYEKLESEELSEEHIKFLEQIGISLFARYYQKKLQRNLELKSGPFWRDVLRSLGGFRRFVIEQIFWHYGGDDQRMQYSILKAEYHDAHGKGFVESWFKLRAWMEGGFYFYGEPLAFEYENETQSFVPNPKLRGVKL